MITLNGANKQLDELLQKSSPPAQVQLVEDETLPPGWAWLCWGKLKIIPICKDLWEAL